MGDPDPSTAAQVLDRRAALRYLAGLGLGAVAYACSGSPSRLSAPTTTSPSSSSSTSSATRSSLTSTSTTAASSSSSAGSSSSASGSTATTGDPAEGSAAASPSTTQPACAVTPQQPEGPYYLNLGLVRSDIAERRPGTPLALKLKVVNSSTCQPIVGATVDVWHCDALGLFSGVQPAPVSAEQGSSPPGQKVPPGETYNGTFLRGIVRTDGAGVATFQTIYPGWYTGRTTHVHVKIRLDGALVHTGQCYFDDAQTDAVYQGAPYNTRPSRDTRNANDPIYPNGGAQSTFTVAVAPGGGYLATVTLAVAAAGGRDPRL